MKRVGILFVSLGLISLSFSLSFACLGARPLSMGGAFVAVSDDIHSCYWNPAGLGNLKRFEATAMKTVNNNDIFNYQQWLAAGLRLGKQAALGVSYVQTVNWWFSVYDINGKYTKNYLTDDEWLTFSVGGYGKGRFSNTAFGLSYRQTSSDLKSGNMIDMFFYGDPKFKVEGYKDKVSELDLGLMHHLGENLTMGLLVQNFNEPRVNFKKKFYACDNGHIFESSLNECPVCKEKFNRSMPATTEWTAKLKHLRNIRPGLAWRPDDKTIVAIDLYYLTTDDVYDPEAKGQSEVRIGFERWCTDDIAIRAGFYGQSFHSIGVGLKGGIPGFKSKDKDKEGLIYQIDYALLESSGVGTHLLSLTSRF